MQGASFSFVQDLPAFAGLESSPSEENSVRIPFSTIGGPARDLILITDLRPVQRDPDLLWLFVSIGQSPEEESQYTSKLNAY